MLWNADIYNICLEKFTKVFLSVLGFCDSALGMESGAIKLNQLNASSSYFGDKGLDYARYTDSSTETDNYWAPEPADDFNGNKEYFEVNFNEMTQVTGITTQIGSVRHFVTSYSIEYLDDGEWTPLTENGSERIFQGNCLTIFLVSLVQSSF